MHAFIFIPYLAQKCVIVSVVQILVGYIYCTDDKRGTSRDDDPTIVSSVELNSCDEIIPLGTLDACRARRPTLQANGPFGRLDFGDITSYDHS